MHLLIKKNLKRVNNIEASIIAALYEQLRDYMTSEYKAISTPLGLDLWLKQGFKGWLKIFVSYKKSVEEEKTKNETKKNNKINLSKSDIELAILVANMVLNSGR